MSISGVSFGNGVNVVKNVETTKVAEAPLKQEQPIQEDKFVKTNEEKTLTKQDKQRIIKAANSNAAGWAIFGGLISTAYYALRSDKTIATKYNLDVNKDKNLISEIRESQVGWTIPGCIPGFGIAPSLISYLYNKCRNENNINVIS